MLDMALLRVKFWKECRTTLASTMFLKAHGMRGLTWARKSYHLLATWGVHDWPEWLVQAKSHESYSGYVKRCLRRRCLAEWSQSVASHVGPLSYSTLQAKPTSLFHIALRLGLLWDALVQQKALSQLRCGQLVLSHKSGRKSRASVRQCIFCNKWYSSIYFHVICSCSFFCQERRGLVDLGIDVSSLHFLAIGPGDPAYPAIARFASSVQFHTYVFWKKGSLGTFDCSADAKKPLLVVRSCEHWVAGAPLPSLPGLSRLPQCTHSGFKLNLEEVFDVALPRAPVPTQGL